MDDSAAEAMGRANRDVIVTVFKACVRTIEMTIVHVIYCCSQTLTFSLLFVDRFIIGHICPEAQEGGPIAVVQNGDIISINAKTVSIEIMVDENELNRRKQEWKMKPYKVQNGYLRRYISNVQDASHGCICDINVF